jgi:hypothetical protein
MLLFRLFQLRRNWLLMPYMRRLKAFGDRLTTALMIAFFIIIAVEAWQYISSFQSRPVAGVAFERVSLVQLLANPERYEARKIQAAGLFVYRQGQQALFLSKEDLENGVSENSVAVVLQNPQFKQADLVQLDGKFISLKGTFNSRGVPDSPQRGREIVAVEEVRSPPYADEAATVLQPTKIDTSR